MDNTIHLKFLLENLTFISVGITKFAILRWINISPGSVSVISLGGALESEHPINKNLGYYPSANFVK